MLRETHEDFVVRSSDFRVEKSAWERPLWIFVLHLRTKKRKNWWLVCKTKNLKFKWKTESETRSSQLVNDAGSKNYQYSIFVGVSISFLSINEIKKEINLTNWEKKKDILGPHAL